MTNPTRRQFMRIAGLAGTGAFGLSSFFVPVNAQDKPTTQPTLIERPQFEIVVPERYRNVKTLGDLIGKERVCLIPPDRNDKEAMAKNAEEREKYLITTRAGISSKDKQLCSFALYANYNGDKGEVNEAGTQIMGVVDLRGVSGISGAYFERHAPISHALKYAAATGQIPMHVYVTETAAGRLIESDVFKQNMLANFSPTFPATVLPNDSEQAKFLRREPCKTGIHEFFPIDCGTRYEFIEPRFIPKR
ncbi:MAG: hypothetical protein KJ858_00330 [Nanoarchaeota archaeon]|nr:hypothetical protein [Nanoarchaeota archaeon]